VDILQPALIWVSDNSALLICVLAIVHLFVFAGVARQYRRQLAALSAYLQEILGPFARTYPDPHRPLEETVDGFIHDVAAAFDDATDPAKSRKLAERLATKDESKGYLRDRGFETGYNVVRTWIQAYPLLGILGTVLAIGLALGPAGPRHASMPDAATTAPAAAVAAADQTAVVRGIVANFEDAIWSTVAGLVFGVLYMTVNSLVEPRFDALSGRRGHVRDLVRAAHERLIADSGPPDTEAES
jgi:biopolymer transport protein ExbB/TolQ